MDTIDQLALMLSLGGTSLVAVSLFVAFLYRLRGQAVAVANRISQYHRTTIVSALVVGSVVLAFLVWLVGESGWRAYHHHYAPFVWFIAFLLNAALGVIYASIGAHLLRRLMPTNPPVNADARDVLGPAKAGGARAGYRER